MEHGRDKDRGSMYSEYLRLVLTLNGWAAL